jgi:hypothetical protein
MYVMNSDLSIALLIVIERRCRLRCDICYGYCHDLGGRYA